jgi:hypothetical protein
MMEDIEQGNDTQTTEGSSPATPPAPAPRLYTEDEVKAYASHVVKERLARERKPSAKSEAQSAPQAAQSSDSGWQYDPEYFSDLLGDVSREVGVELNSEQRKMFRDDVKAVRPSDQLQWLRSRLSLGARSEPTAQAKTEQPQTQQTTKQPTAAAGQANNAIPTGGALEVSAEVPPMKWSAEQIARFQQVHGLAEANRRIAKLNQDYRQKLLSGASYRK